MANIGLEHTAILGDTVEKIAAEKCGIIKQGSHAVLFGQSEGVENVAREKCAQEDVALTITAQEKLERISSSLDGQEFKYRGRGPYHLRLLGEYQLLNALTVIDVCNALRSRGWDKLTDEAIDDGFPRPVARTARAPAPRPDFIVDGAHNPQCVDALMDSARRALRRQKTHLPHRGASRQGLAANAAPRAPARQGVRRHHAAFCPRTR